MVTVADFIHILKSYSHTGQPHCMIQGEVFLSLNHDKYGRVSANVLRTPISLHFSPLQADWLGWCDFHLMVCPICISIYSHDTLAGDPVALAKQVSPYLVHVSYLDSNCRSFLTWSKTLRRAMRQLRWNSKSNKLIIAFLWCRLLCRTLCSRSVRASVTIQMKATGLWYCLLCCTFLWCRLFCCTTAK